MEKNIFKYITRPHVLTQKILKRWLGIPFSKWLVNFIFQRIFRINSDVPFQVHFTSTISVGKGIYIGKNVWKSFALSGSCYIQGGNGIFIGDDTIFAPGVKIISANHDMANLSVWKTENPLRIGKRCWIGANTVILPGVEICDDCIIGAGSVVTKSIGSKAVVGGNPAKIIREL